MFNYCSRKKPVKIKAISVEKLFIIVNLRFFMSLDRSLWINEQKKYSRTPQSRYLTHRCEVAFNLTDLNSTWSTCNTIWREPCCWIHFPFCLVKNTRIPWMRLKETNDTRINLHHSKQYSAKILSKHSISITCHFMSSPPKICGPLMMYAWFRASEIHGHRRQRQRRSPVHPPPPSPCPVARTTQSAAISHSWAGRVAGPGRRPTARTLIRNAWWCHSFNLFKRKQYSQKPALPVLIWFIWYANWLSILWYGRFLLC